MCFDHCEWLWQALCRPAPPQPQRQFPGECGVGCGGECGGSPSDREPDEIHYATDGSSSDPLTDEEEGSHFGVGDGGVVAELLQRMSSGEIDDQRAASKELRYIAKESPDKKILIARAGSIPLLVDLLSTRDPETQEHAVTTLLNLSIINANKDAIVRAGAVDSIVEVLKSGSMEARENAAATLFSLSVLDENKVIIGNSSVFAPLVDLLRDGTMRGKQDAASALFNLSLDNGNKPKAVAAGVLAPLVKLLCDTACGMVDVALAIVSLLATNKDCIGAIADAHAIPALIDLIKSGSPGIKENALVILLALCESYPTQAYLAKQGGASPYVAELARSGIPRARRKAAQLLDLLNTAEHNAQ